MTIPANLSFLADGASSTGVLGVANGGTGVTTSTGSGSNVLSTSPTLVTPTLGAATATSLALGGATIGSNALAVTGSTNLIGALTVAPASGAASGAIKAVSGQTASLSVAGNGTTVGNGDLRLTQDASSIGYLYNNSNAALSFGTNSAESMRIDSSGNVSIGTSSPNAKLDILTTASTRMLFTERGTGGNVIDSVNGTNSAYTQFLLNGNPLIFATNATESMRIDSSGNLLIGATSTVGTAKLYVNGAVGSEGILGRQGATGTSTGNLINFWWVGSSLQAWVDSTNVGNITLTSDYRIKRNIQTQTTSALDRILKLRPVTYQIADYKNIFKASDDIKEGFIAHELSEIIPSAVNGEKDDENQIQSLKLDALCSVLVKAIQELSAKVDAQAAEITALQAKVGS
jgi:hypothetical protein